MKLDLVSNEVPIPSFWLGEIKYFNDSLDGCQIFLPIPKKQPNEGIEHYQQKIRVAKAIQQHLTHSFEHDSDGSVGSAVISIEYTFPRAKPPFGENAKHYIADIFLRIYGDTPNQKRLDIEIDGKKGHGSLWNQAKNRIRDDIITDETNEAENVIRIPLSLLAGVKTHVYRSITNRSFSITPMTEPEIIDFINEKSDNSLSK